jgi:hypothetical protein
MEKDNSRQIELSNVVQNERVSSGTTAFHVALAAAGLGARRK